ncbi:GNAT family N-acetyltransferase [Amnibacterium sp. CER49]|uniref:GNAT family N-acetyltransferase n=1 Tax=Amnibacterium sp. CER49 TaxID=3039161 RepID=UPI00244ABDD2|nr:GNAT family N-acetyltransferase [Amnibacterium sp. CER49]MDH2442753.1 GNAT family N-acetyltransferase [Amnibacterium sp. CER49]
MTPEQLRDLYDQRLRPWVEPDPAPGLVFERFGDLVRVTGRRQGFVETGPDVGLRGAELDAAIAAHRDHFAARGEELEWKTRAHDLPADLPDRLLAAGFEPEHAETVVVGVAADMVDAAAEPEGVRIRRTADPDDYVRIAAMESAVWGEDWSWLAPDLERETAHDPEHFLVFVAEADGEVVSAAWLANKPGTGFGGLWGGSTLPGWRRRGIYRALVAVRARAALERGVEYLQVDASKDSSPVLERLGFVAVTTTTPYVWRPGRAQPAMPTVRP